MDEHRSFNARTSRVDGTGEAWLLVLHAASLGPVCWSFAQKTGICPTWHLNVLCDFIAGRMRQAMNDQYALVGGYTDGQGKVLAMNVTADEARRIKRSLDRMNAYATIEVVPMRLLPDSPEHSQK